MVLTEALAALALGMGSARYIESLLYQGKPGDLAMLAPPSFAIPAAAFVAAVIRAVRIGPVTILRAK